MKRKNQVAPRNNFNPTRNRRSANAKAFLSIIGDPTAVPESIEGLFYMFPKRSDIPAIQNDFDMGKPTGNRAAPSKDDFLIDVEKVVRMAIPDKNLLKNFWDFYTLGDTKALTRPQRSRLEQRIGQLFRDHHIYPARGYFTTVRRKRERR